MVKKSSRRSEVLHKRKKDRKQGLPNNDINITSLMDILTTLLFFILMVMSLQKFSILESTSLTAGKESDDKKPVFTLHVTLLGKGKGSIWLGPIEGLEKEIVNLKGLSKFLKRNFKGSKKLGFSRFHETKGNTALLKRVQRDLIFIKKSFPREMKAVISFTDNVNYQDMINGLSAIRELGPKEDGFKVKTLDRKSEITKVLFPQVIIAEEEGA